MPAMIELFGTGLGSSPNVYKVLLLLEELEMPYRLTKVDLTKGEQFSAKFLDVCPNNKVPAILDHDPADGGAPLRVFESGSVLIYLADKAGRFIPRQTNPRARAEVTNWLMWQMANLGPYVGQMFHFLVYAPEKLPYAIKRYSNEVSRLFQLIDQRLADSPWIGGDEYSIADMAIFPVSAVWRDCPQDFSRLKHFFAWREKIESRAAYARAYDLGKIANETMGADKFFEEKTWKRLFAQDENTAAEYARESTASAAD
jgi:GSH-dependent disulfide-bond oxidoreductase